MYNPWVWQPQTGVLQYGGAVEGLLKRHSFPEAFFISSY
jgi:hypothetical protein